MSTFGNFILRQEYEAVAARGDPLNEIEGLIDWERFRPRLSTLYKNDSDQGGRPHTDENSYKSQLTFIRSSIDLF